MGFEWLHEEEYRDAERLRPSQMSRHETGMFHVTQHEMDDLWCFGDRRDKLEFLDRFQRVLSPAPTRDPVRREMFPWLRPRVSLVAFCLLDNHYHLILRQFSTGGVAALMRSVLRSYGHHFNTKYGRTKVPIFREPWSATKINDSLHGARAMAYVTLNEENRRERYEFCSYDYYVGARRAAWLDVRSGLWFFGGSPEEYQRYLAGEGTEALERKIARRADRPLPKSKPLRRGPATHIKRRS